MTTRGTCPSPSALEGFATNTRTDVSMIAHVDSCDVCRAAVEEIRENNRFLAGARTLLAAQGAAEAPGADDEPGHMAGEGAMDTPGGALEADAATIEPAFVRGYQIQEELHRGGQGVVYRAIQARTRRTVAIKMLLGWRGANARQKERFEREIRIAAALRHPNIVTVHDSGYISDGRYGLVMEYIEGATLDRWSRGLDEANRIGAGRGRDARRQVLRTRLGVMMKVCDAVLCAHQRSIVHRDLKPANILVDAAGEPHVLDFGIARDIGPEQHTRLTHTGEFAGTLAYASPEQVSGDMTKVDTRSDVYSLGVILYELVSGKMPYSVDGPMSQALRNIESVEPVPLPRHTRDPDAPWVDGEVATITLKALSKDPARRYQTVAGLRDDIERYLAGKPIDARRDSTWYVLRKTAARHRVAVTAAGLIIVLLMAFGAAMAWQAYRLDVRGKELASALSASNIERGRSLAAAGSIALAEEAVWPELVRAGVTRIDGPEAGFIGTPEAIHAYWGMWDVVRRSSCVATLRARDKAVTLLFFDDDGRRLNVFDLKGQLTSWSVATWQRVRQTDLVAPLENKYFRSAVASDGRIAVFGDGLIRVIEPATGAIEAQVDDPDVKAFTGVFSPGGALLATVGWDHRIYVRDGHSLQPTITIAEQSIRACKPAFSLDGGLVAGALPDGSLGLWSTGTGTLERTLRPPESLDSKGSAYVPIRTAFGPDGAIACLMGPHLIVWPADGTPPKHIGPDEMIAGNLAFLPGSQGRLIATSGEEQGGGDGLTIVWDLTTGERAATFGQAGDTNSLAASPDGRLIATGELSGIVRVYEVPRDPHVTVLQAPASGGSVAALSHDGKTVALTAHVRGQTGRDLLVMDLRSGDTLRRFQRDDLNTCVLEFGPDDRSLFEGEVGGRIVQWDLASGTAVREFITPEPAIPDAPNGPNPPNAQAAAPKATGRLDFNQLRLSPDASMLARARADGVVDLWDVPSGRWIDCLDGGAKGFAVIEFSPDGETLAVRASDTCVLWDIKSRKVMRSIVMGGEGGSVPVRFSPDGRVIAGTVQGCIGIFDVETGRLLMDNNVRGSVGLGMVFHPDGNVLFGASTSGNAINVWDTRTGRELLSLKKHNAMVISVLLSPDGNTLISSDWSGAVLAWDLAYYNERIGRELEHRGAMAPR